MTRTHCIPAAALLTALVAALPAGATDMSFTPATGSAVVINTDAGAPALRVEPSGAVQVPGLPGTAATLTTAVCHDAGGVLGRCDPAALAGPQGPQGPQGPAGPAGTTGSAGAPGAPGAPGTPGADGKPALVATTTEPAGANCATGGVRMQWGLDANGNGTLDTGEVNAALTRYVCNGPQGPRGLDGPQGPQGPAGAGGVTGLAEVRHGCFQANASVTSGSGYTAALNAGVYTVTFAPALGAGSYTLMLDARTSTGRALAITTGGDVDTGLTFIPGWLDAGGETIGRICFMLAR